MAPPSKGTRTHRVSSTAEIRPTKHISTAIAAGLVALVVLVYWPVARFGFVALDDAEYVLNNPHVQSGLTWSSIVWAWTTVYASNWHPLTWMSHMLDVNLFGSWAGGHHLTNLALHALNTVLLFRALRRLTRTTWRSAFVAALFAVHPLHVESVAWIAERKDVLSGTFWMLTMFGYARYAAKPSAGRYALVVVAFALGLTAKPMLVSLPLILLLLDWWPLRRPMTPRLIVEKLPLAALAIASSAMTVVAQREGGALRALELYPASLRMENAIVSSAVYLVKSLWPTHLAVFYPFPDSISGAVVAAAAAFLVIASSAAVALRRRAPYVATGWFWYLIALAPVVGVVQAGSQARADRYTYVPLIGIFILVAWGGRWVVAAVSRRAVSRAGESGNRTFAATASVLLVLCVLVSSAQVQYWRDGLTLWQRAAAAVPDNYRAEAAVGLLLRGTPDRRDEAIQHLQNAVRLRPDLVQAHAALGDLLFERGDVRGAIDHLRSVTQITPASPAAWLRLGVALARDGQTVAAIAAVENVLKLEPGNPAAKELLAKLR